MSRLVYIVDDQASILEAMVLVVESVDPSWKVVGYTSPGKALEAARANPPDLVLSDHQMPEMAGSKFLEEMRTTAPNAVRVIVSGYVNLKAISGVVTAHQYITKPFDLHKLKALIQRAFAAQARVKQSELHQVVTALRSLPTLPHVYYMLLEELSNENHSSDIVAELIAKDAGLSAKVLQLANSPLFGRGTLVSSPFEAVMCLGTELIKAIVLSQEAHARFSRLKSSGLHVARVWSHSWEVAQLTRCVCQKLKLTITQTNEAFLAGLLHEMGKLILLDNFPERFQQACTVARETEVPLSLALLGDFKSTPAQVAAYLLELWGMPEQVVLAVADQEYPEATAGAELSLATVLYIADQLATRRSPPDAFAIPTWNAEYLATIGCENDLAVWQESSSGQEG